MIDWFFIYLLAVLKVASAVKDEVENPFYTAPSILRQLERSKIKVLKGNLDRVFVIDGREGEGKILVLQDISEKWLLNQTK